MPRPGWYSWRTTPSTNGRVLVAITPTGRRLAARLFADSARQRTAEIDRVGVTAGELRVAGRTIQRLLQALHDEAG